MPILFVVDNPKSWPLEVPDVDVVAARAYLTEPGYSHDKSARVFNLCRSYRYQSTGYYVSLLAAARGHRPMPDVPTILDLRSRSVVRMLSEEFDEEIQRSLKTLQSNEFTLSIYFGRNVAKRYDRLSLRLFNLFRAPLLRARFKRTNRWQLQSIRPIAANDIPEPHHPTVIEAAAQYFARRRSSGRRRAQTRYDLALLYNPQEPEPPSNGRALQRFERAARAVGLACELITRDDYHRLAEFDALFIRETTNVNHHTYRFAQRAAAQGLVVVDDPESILKCTNKVYVEELLSRHGVPTPKTAIVHRDNVEQIETQIGLPCILKQPDSAFSAGVVKVEDRTALQREVTRLLAASDLIIAQEFVPTAFDWRVGIFDRRPLYVCRYYMARRHWQIIDRGEGGKIEEGMADTLAVGEAPDAVVRTALRAANLIGDGLYGVDIKQLGQRCVVIEINDNPSIDAGCEDAVLKDALYREIMGVFLKRIQAGKADRLPT